MPLTISPTPHPHTRTPLCSCSLHSRNRTTTQALRCFRFVAQPQHPPTTPATGLVFHVGGPRGWRVPDANTSYGWWAVNNRFNVGDALYFKYGGGDSVLVVDREAFDGCNATEPIARFADGATNVPLDRPGFFCFISGAPGHCEEGQRLIVRVMVHPAETPPPAPGPALAPATPGAAPAPAPGSGSGSCVFPGAPSGAAAVAAGAALAAAMGVLVGLVLLLQ